jgi:hypothetical protein
MAGPAVTTQAASLPNRSFRQGWSPAVGHIIGGWFLVNAALVAVFAPGILWKSVTILGNVAVTAYCWFRLARIGPVFTRKGLKIVRLLSTTLIPWSEVRGFVLRPHGSARLAGHARLGDGSFIWLPGVGSWYRFAKASAAADAVIHEMNTALPEYKHASDEGR